MKLVIDLEKTMNNYDLTRQELESSLARMLDTINTLREDENIDDDISNVLYNIYDLLFEVEIKEK